MTTYLRSLALLLTLSVCLGVCRTISDDLLEITASPGWNITLQCTAKYKPGVQYVAVTWYKLGGNPSLYRRGLLRRDLPDGKATPYEGSDREVELLDESHHIFLPNVTCNDTGVYLCSLAAPVGEQNRDGRVLLTLPDCPPVDITFCPVDAADLPFHPTGNLMVWDDVVVFAIALLMVAFFISLIGYCCVKNTFRERSKPPKKEILLDAPPKELEKKDLMLIYTLGPKTSSFKHICV